MALSTATLYVNKADLLDWLKISEWEFQLIEKGNGVSPNGCHLTVKLAPRSGPTSYQVVLAGYAYDGRDVANDVDYLARNYDSVDTSHYLL